MKKSLPYILAFLAGLFARTAIAAMNGWEGYHLNGIDLTRAQRNSISRVFDNYSAEDARKRAAIW